MVPDDLGQQLHDKETRGEPLTPPESAQLDEWYRQQDAAEVAAINGNNGTLAVAVLRKQVNEALDQMKAVAGDIHELANTNERLQNEVATLRARLARQAQPA
jgi:hypothetical protein